MHDPSRTIQELTEENALLKQRIQELKISESERKQAEEALRESEEKYRILFEGINDALFVHDLDEEGQPGRFLQVNDVACRRLGYTREELLSLTPRDITMPEEYERIADRRIDLASQGDILTETIHVTKNGLKVPVESNIRQFQYLDRQVALSISRDITDRRRAEEALRNTEQRLHSIIDGSPIPAFVIGKDHRVIYWNKALEEMSRIKPAEVVGTSEHWKAFYNEKRLCMADLLVDGAVELVPKWYSGKYIKSPLIEDAYEATDFFPALGKDGKWLRFTAAAIRESNGMIVAAVETLEDITEHKRAEEARFKSEERFRITLMSIGDGVITTDAEGRVDLLNPVAENLSGWSQGEARGKPLEEVFRIINEETRQPVENPVLQVLRDGLVVGLANHTVLIARNGRERPIADSGSPIFGADGAITGTVLIFRDQTEERKAQNELKALGRRFSKIIDFLPDPTMAIDSEKRVTIWNRAMEELTGVPAAEMLGKGDYAYTIPFYGVARPQLMDLFWVPDHEIAQKYPAICKDRDNLVIEVFCPDLHNGKGAHVWAKAASFCDADGRLIGAIESIRDITERKRAEEALRENEEKYRTVADFAYAWEYWIAPDGKYIYVSPACERISGYQVEEFQQDTNLMEKIIHPDDRQLLASHIHDVLQGKSDACELQFRIITRVGKECWISHVCRDVYSHTGEYLGRRSSNHDITERKQAEEALALHVERTQALLDIQMMANEFPQTILDFVLQASLKVSRSQFSFIGLMDETESFMTIHAWSKETMAQCASMDKPIHFPIAEAGVWGDCVRQRKPVMINHYEAHQPGMKGYPDGHVPIRRFLGVPVFDGKKIVAVAAVANKKTDYTGDDVNALISLVNNMWSVLRRKQTEEALRQTEENFRRSLDESPLGVRIATEEGETVYVNRAILDVHGYDSIEEYKATPVEKRYTPESYAEFKTRREKRRQGVDDPFEYAINVIRKNGEVRYLQVLRKEIQWDGKRQFQVVYHDITERRQLEEEKKSLAERLQRAEKMEALGLLAGGVAHDLNNVLGVVVGYAELVLMKADESSPIRPQLVNIMNGGLKATAIVDDLLTLARRGVSDRDVLNLNKIIADCQKSPEFEKLYSYHPSVKINTDIDPDLLNISGSSVHLGKSLYNLVSNASEAMTKGGLVTIKTTNQYLDKPIQGYDHIQEGDYVVLSVSDTGEGIPAADLKRIFEPFYTKKVMGRSGTGLGLAVVWGTVKDHHGYINVESEEGKGSTFTLYFPVIREDITAEAVAIAISEYMGNGESILVVDDVKEQRDLAAGMLGKLNYNVTSVSSGEEAVAYMKEHQVDLMVLDMIMDPGMDGLDTYRSVIEIHPKQKAIIVSGFSESDRVKYAQTLGAGPYVRKPYVLEKLGLAVKKELDRK